MVSVYARCNTNRNLLEISVVGRDGPERRRNPVTPDLEEKSYFFEFSGGRKVDRARRPRIYQRRSLVSVNADADALSRHTEIFTYEVEIFKRRGTPLYQCRRQNVVLIVFQFEAQFPKVETVW